MKWLIIDGTDQGQAAMVARRIEHDLLGLGDDTDLYDAAALPSSLNMALYDAVIVGTSVRAEKIPRTVRQFVGQHLAELRPVPTAFFSVSLCEACPEQNQLRLARSAMDAFLEETGWQPDTVASFAGAIPLVRGDGRAVRWVVWYGPRHDDIVTKTAGYEYTDWDAVEHFAGDCAMHARHVRLVGAVRLAHAAPR